MNHDNIARVFYAGTQDGLYFIAYEYASGKTIRDLIIERGQLSIEDTVNYAIQVTLALNHIAAAGIVHRDIKPANLLIDAEGNTLLADFGLAKPVDATLDLTGGRIVGTPRFLAPEVIQGQPADVRSDLYALGATLYEALAATPIYAADTPLQLFHQIAAGRIVDLKTRCPTAPPRGAHPSFTGA